MLANKQAEDDSVSTTRGLRAQPQQDLFSAQPHGKERKQSWKRVQFWSSMGRVIRSSICSRILQSCKQFGWMDIFQSTEAAALGGRASQWLKSCEVGKQVSRGFACMHVVLSCLLRLEHVLQECQQKRPCIMDWDACMHACMLCWVAYLGWSMYSRNASRRGPALWIEILISLCLLDYWQPGYWFMNIAILLVYHEMKPKSFIDPGMLCA